jgi:hypothetical protein
MSTWRGGGRLGYRVGLAEDDLEEVAVFAGVDASGVFVAASDDFPIDVDWVTGVGFGVGDAFLLTVPLGLSAGRELQVEGMLFNPYATPRVVLDAFFGGEVPGNDLELGFAVDLGMDLSFDPGWAVRFAGTVGDREALAIGFSFRFL